VQLLCWTKINCDMLVVRVQGNSVYRGLDAAPGMDGNLGHLLSHKKDFFPPARSRKALLEQDW